MLRRAVAALAIGLTLLVLAGSVAGNPAVRNRVDEAAATVLSVLREQAADRDRPLQSTGPN